VLFDPVQVLLEKFFDNIKNKRDASGGKIYCLILYKSAQVKFGGYSMKMVEW
jgi:hypothetical protein